MDICVHIGILTVSVWDDSYKHIHKSRWRVRVDRELNFFKEGNIRRASSSLGEQVST